MLRVAVCWSGLTRGVDDAVKFNKQFFDSLSDTISFDHICHFWNEENRYPIESDTEYLIKNHFKELDVIPIQETETVQTIIKILQPITVSSSNFAEMTHMLIKHKFPSEIPYDRFDEEFKHVDDIIIDKSAADLNFFDNLERHGYRMLCDYNLLVMKLSQFYGFEKSVSLVSQRSKCDYDIILRMRYDVLLLPHCFDNLVNAMYYAKQSDSLLVNNFRGYNFDVIHQNLNVSYFTSSNINDLVGSEFGIEDMIFLGPLNHMTTLANDLSNTICRLLFLPKVLLEREFPIQSESLWFSAIKNKNIPCQSLRSDLYAGVFIVRENSNFNALEQVGFNVSLFFKTNSAPMFFQRRPEVDWNNASRYFIPPNDYILAKIFLQFSKFVLNI